MMRHDESRANLSRQIDSLCGRHVAGNAAARLATVDRQK